jgi:beta-lactamase superfamily II metal-dependent hydrolase
MNRSLLPYAIIAIAIAGCSSTRDDQTRGDSALLPSPLASISGAKGNDSVKRDDKCLIRVIDAGQAECCIAVIPPKYGETRPHYFIYDAGEYPKQTINEVKKLIPLNSIVDLMVISHSDCDHIGAVKEICDNYDIKTIIHSGNERPGPVYQGAKSAILKEKEQGAKVFDLSNKHNGLAPGSFFTFGDAKISFVIGYCDPPKEWGLKDDSELKNAGSIVMRLEYNSNSVLFCGDTVGRRIGDDKDVCIAAEKEMVDQSSVVPIRANVIIAPHHGADNGSSTEFIKAINPTYVIFSAGHKHNYLHPRKTTAQRYLDGGVNINNIFRTDLGDNEGGEEWSYGGTGKVDKAGDDNIDITIDGKSNIEVKYSHPDGLTNIRLKNGNIVSGSNVNKTSAGYKVTYTSYESDVNWGEISTVSGTYNDNVVVLYDAAEIEASGMRDEGPKTWTPLREEAAKAPPSESATPSINAAVPAVATQRTNVVPPEAPPVVREATPPPSPGPAASSSGGASGNGSYYGEPNKNGTPKTVPVKGYMRKDGAYVKPHYRAPPKRK